MAKIEQMELDGRRSEIIADVKSFVEKYRAIFDWDVPEIDQNVADKVILRTAACCTASVVAPLAEFVRIDFTLFLLSLTVKLH